MTNTTKTLRLTFVGTDAKKYTLALTDAKANLNEEEVRVAMEKIATSNLFEKEEVQIYARAHAAAYVDRTVADIFDDSAATAGGQN